MDHINKDKAKKKANYLIETWKSVIYKLNDENIKACGNL